MKTTLDNAIPTIIGNAVRAISNTPHMGRYSTIFTLFHIHTYNMPVL
jgi:hypothetical protein